MTREEAAEWRSRWSRVNEAEIEELRRTPVSVKLEQLAAMMSAALEMGWTDALGRGEEEVRARWKRIREAGGA
jgi:hypothetical protein